MKNKIISFFALLILIVIGGVWINWATISNSTFYFENIENPILAASGVISFIVLYLIIFLQCINTDSKLETVLRLGLIGLTVLIYIFLSSAGLSVSLLLKNILLSSNSYIEYCQYNFDSLYCFANLTTISRLAPFLLGIIVAIVISYFINLIAHKVLRQKNASTKFIILIQGLLLVAIFELLLLNYEVSSVLIFINALAYCNALLIIFSSENSAGEDQKKDPPKKEVAKIEAITNDKKDDNKESTTENIPEKNSDKDKDNKKNKKGVDEDYPWSVG